MPYIYVRYVLMPRCVDAVVTPNDDCTFDIYINSNLCIEKQKRALEHELAHIKMDHLYNEDPVIINEREAG